MDTHYRPYELPQVQPVSPINPTPYTWEGSSQEPYPRDKKEPRLSEVSLDDDITNSRSPFASANLENESRSMLTSTENRVSFRGDQIQASPLETKNRRFFSAWATAAASVVSSIFTLYYCYTVLVNTNAVPNVFVTAPGTTVLIVNVLSHLVAFLVWGLFSDTFEALRWALASRQKGILLTSFLALSRATPLSGVLYLCTTVGAHQFWALWRYEFWLRDL